ncbi:MAG: hypothetical protein GX986_06890 [Firmicutes bacterium]|nr:hypothetical protein [Bacillota bacterium]
MSRHEKYPLSLVGIDKPNPTYATMLTEPINDKYVNEVLLTNLTRTILEIPGPLPAAP